MIQFLDERLPTRFWSKVQPCPMSGCWIWTGATTTGGYGTIKLDGRSFLVHRLAYLKLLGEIGEGLQLDHRCRVTQCCNPAHCEPVTQSVNVRRSRAPEAQRARHAAVTHCPKGHPYDATNTMFIKNVRCQTRRCRTCANARRRKWRPSDAAAASTN